MIQAVATHEHLIWTVEQQIESEATAINIASQAAQAADIHLDAHLISPWIVPINRYPPMTILFGFKHMSYKTHRNTVTPLINASLLAAALVATTVTTGTAFAEDAASAPIALVNGESITAVDRDTQLQQFRARGQQASPDQALYKQSINARYRSLPLRNITQLIFLLKMKPKR